MSARLPIACLLAILVGCGRQQTTPSASVDGSADTAGGDSTTTAPQPGPTAADTTPAAETQIVAVLNDLTQAVRRYGVEQRRAPTTLDELVTHGYLDRVPSAPPGKKYAINKNFQVYLANR